MISKKTIHAIEVCVYLAGQRHAGYVTTTEMSPRLDLSISYLENILKPLKARHIVSAMKGPGGGYMIQGDMSLISIWDIASVLECTLDVSLSTDADMCHDKSMPASYELGLEQIVKATLSNFTLADFVDESATKKPARLCKAWAVASSNPWWRRSCPRPLTRCFSCP